MLRWERFIVVLAACFLAGCIQIGPAAPTRLETVVVESSPRLFERNRIAIIEVEGFLGSQGGLLGMLSTTSPADLREKLDLAAADKRVRAVILRVNSPGGEVTSSDMMHSEVLRFKARTGKPVVAMFMSTAASGGYYVAAACDYIVAAPTCVTGSIGVIAHYTNIEGLFTKIGLRDEVIKSGEKKDIGSPTRPLAADERQILQDINDAFFQRFLAVVREGRPRLIEADIRTFSDGRVLTADQALALHLVDEVGYPNNAVSAARRLAGIESATVVQYRASLTYNSNIYARGEAGLLERGMQMVLRRGGAAFYYLWSPGL